MPTAAPPAPVATDQVAPIIEPTAPAVSRAIAAFEAAGLKSSLFSEEEAVKTVAHGLSQQIAIAALGEIADGCADPGPRTCLGSDETRLPKAQLVRWLEHLGDDTAAHVLLRLDGQGDFRARRILEKILMRRSERIGRACSPPTDELVSAIGSSIYDFAVFDQDADRLVARRLTREETNDLAYFLAAVNWVGRPVGGERDTFVSGTKLSDTYLAAREAEAARLERAQFAGDADQIIRLGLVYLAQLGFPGAIDESLEAAWSWGGARFSYVMRDVALAAEVAGRYDLAADLYRRANPAGGACGTTVDRRRRGQLRGLIRSVEAAGRCEEVVAERLLDLEGEKQPFYGPDPLATAGFDIARIYRGALLTRHRDAPKEALLEALSRAPQGFAIAAGARLEKSGNEAWEKRVLAIEGIADTLGREGGFYLATVLPHLGDNEARRAISSIGSAGLRYQIGPCQQDSPYDLGFGRSSIWTRPINVFGTSCARAYSDEEVERLYKMLRPGLRAVSRNLARDIAWTASSIGAVTSLRDLRQLRARQLRAFKRCKPDNVTYCVPVEIDLEVTNKSIARIKALQTESRSRHQ